MKKYFVHERAIVESKKIGEGSRTWAFSHILPGAVIGKNVNICEGCLIENDVVLGDNTTVKCGVYIWDGVRVENKVFIGPNVTFTNDKFPRSKNIKYKQEKTIIKEGCSIGANSTIIAGVVLGKYAMVGAGSLVTKDVRDFTLVYGNPASEKGWVCKCGQKISRDLCCFACNKKYLLTSGILIEEK